MHKSKLALIIRYWRTRLFSFTASFLVGLLVVLLYGLIIGIGHLNQPNTIVNAPIKTPTQVATPKQSSNNCENYFVSPEQIVTELKSQEVSIRGDIYKRLFLQPGIDATYLDYERDLNYPEQADNVRIRYINLDNDAEPEALVTFVRYAHPIALILKHRECGWQYLAMLNSWLKHEEYPYDEWLDLIETVHPGTFEILIHESSGSFSDYQSNAKLYKLLDNQLIKIAEFVEEQITPTYNGKDPDWGNLKQKATTNYYFFTEKPGEPAHIEMETLTERVRYSGYAANYRFWRDTDTSWHYEMRHWRTRPVQQLAVLSKCNTQLTWQPQRRRFIKEECSLCAQH